MTRAGGGGGGAFSNTGTPTAGSGGSGGGGNGGRAGNASSTGTAGTANTGGGGGARPNFASYAGGSGVVIVRYPATFTISVGAGLTSSNTTQGGSKITTFTAGTGPITFS